MVMTERPTPEASAELRTELSRIAWRVDRWIDHGPAAVVGGGATAAAAAALLMPWTAGAPGWRVLAGDVAAGPLPRLFVLAATLGAVLSALALLVRFWPLAWASGALCGAAAVTGLWAIWSLRTAVPAADVDPGLVVEVLAVLVLAATWARISLSPPG